MPRVYQYNDVGLTGYVGTKVKVRMGGRGPNFYTLLSLKLCYHIYT